MILSRNAGILLSAAVCFDSCFSGGAITVASLGFSSLIESAAKIAPNIFGGLATTFLTKDIGRGFNQELEKVIQQSVEKTLEAVKADFLDNEEFHVSWWESLVYKTGFDIPDFGKNFLIKQSLLQNFFDPLYKLLSNEKAIDKFISKNSQLNAGNMLEQILSTNQIKVPEYLEKYKVSLHKSIVDGFKNRFLYHFSEILHRNEPARKYYQTLLLQSTFNLLQSTFRQVENQDEQIKKVIELADYHKIHLEGIEKSILEGFQKQSQAMDQLRQDFLRQFGLALDIRKKRSEDERNQFSYVSLFTDFQGRTLEMDILFNFLNDDRKFLFYALSGSGGSGKSRLANQLCLKAESMHWLSGFSDKDNNSLFRWESIQTTANTLIVLDYVRGRKDQVVQILKSLSSLAYKNLFEDKVRVLLLERSFDKDLTREIFSPRTREYYYSYVINQKEKPLELEPMDDDVRWAIIEQILLPNPEPYKKLSLRRSEIIEALNRQDPEKRPLFTFFSAVALLEGKDITHWNTKDNLDYHLKRLEDNIWSQIPLWKKFETPLKHLIWLGAICEFLENRDFTIIQNFEPFTDIPKKKWRSEDFWKELFQLFNLESSQFSQGEFPGIKPDLMAEHYIVTHITKYSSEKYSNSILNQLFQCAWSVRPERVWWMSYLTLSNYVGQDNYSISEYLKWLEAGEEHLLHGENASNLFFGLALFYYEKEDKNNSKRWYSKAAELGNAEAMFNLALLLDNENPEKAEEWTGKAAELGNAYAMFNLGRLLHNKDPEKAKEWYRKAAELGNVQAMFNIGFLLENHDPEKAKEWYRKAAELGNDRAMHSLAILLQNDEPNLAKLWYGKAAELGHTNAMFGLALLLQNNDPEQAKEWHRKAAELGHIGAMLGLALMFGNGEPDQAKKWYKKAADLGNARAMLGLALLLENEDPEQSREWYTKSTELGDDNAMVGLAFLLRNDDPEQAKELYRRAAELGNADGMAYLALFLETDYPEQAKTWYRKAAELGHASAMNNLALLLENNEPETAKLWYGKAAELGNTNAMYGLALLLRKDDLNQAKQWYRHAAERGHIHAMYDLARLLHNDDPNQAKVWYKNAAEMGHIYAKVGLSILLRNDDKK